MEPIVFTPIFQERIWGGRRLESDFGKALPAGKAIGESWEIVDRPEAQSVVRQGPFAGRTLHDLWTNERAEIFGADTSSTPRFPLFAKLLDARKRLSLQVHPPPGVAAALGSEPKTEMWYVLAAEPGAEIFFGLRRGTTRAEFEHALADRATADFVHRLEVREGDAFFLPSGRLHAIGAGLLLVEIQQNSDTTYRVFDWDREDEQGRKRALHLGEAMRSIDFNDFEPGLVRLWGEELVRCPHFLVEKWELKEPRRALDERSFAIFVCLSGAVECAGLEFRASDFFLMPANAGEARLIPGAPATALLRCTASDVQAGEVSRPLHA